MTGGMAKYLRLILIFLKNSLQIEMEYRVNFAGLFIMSILDAVWSVGGAILFYSHRASIGGWVFNEALVVIGLYFLAYGFVDSALRPNIDALVEHIRTGTLDFVLAKPINSQVHVTLRNYRFQKLSSVFMGGVIIVYALVQLRQSPTFEQVALFVLLCAGAALLLYAAMTLLCTVSFWAIDISNIDDFITGFLEAGRYPAQAFPEPIRGLITLVVPIAFITTVPAEVILGKLTPQFLFYGWMFAILLSALSVFLWKVAVRHYSSASS
jgi:ABC-2 type transport system permease protein